jgi:hypothetical protein
VQIYTSHGSSGNTRSGNNSMIYRSQSSMSMSESMPESDMDAATKALRATELQNAGYTNTKSKMKKKGHQRKNSLVGH